MESDELANAAIFIKFTVWDITRKAKKNYNRLYRVYAIHIENFLYLSTARHIEMFIMRHFVLETWKSLHKAMVIQFKIATFFAVAFQVSFEFVWYCHMAFITISRSKSILSLHLTRDAVCITVA